MACYVFVGIVIAALFALFFGPYILNRWSK